MVAIPVPKRIHILGLVASDLAVGDAGLGLLGAAGCARGETPALVETVGTHEAAQRRIGRHRFSSASSGTASCWRTARRSGGARPLIRSSIANSSAMRSSASLAKGEAVAS